MKVEPIKFLSEFLPGFWKRTPIQIFVAILIYAAMQQGNDNETRALLSPVLLSPRPQCGRRRKLGQESKRVSRGVRTLRGKGVPRGSGPGGVNRKSSCIKAGSRAATAIQVCPSKTCKLCVKLQMNRRVHTSQRMRVTPVTVGESVRSKFFLLAEKRMVLPELHMASCDSVCLNCQVNNTTVPPSSLTRPRPSRK